MNKFLKSIGLWFISLFNWFSAAWKKLSSAEQNAAIQASSIIAIVNENLTATPDVVFTLIQTKFPSITKEALTGYLNTINATVKQTDSIVNDDFATTMKNLQSYLGSVTGNKWVTITKSVVGLLVGILTPSTPIQKIELVLEYVYQNFVKKN